MSLLFQDAVVTIAASRRASGEVYHGHTEGCIPSNIQWTIDDPALDTTEEYIIRIPGMRL